MIYIVIFKPTEPYRIEFMGGPNDGGQSLVAPDWPDSVVFVPDDTERPVIYERDEHDPTKYRFRGWDVKEKGESGG